MKGRTREATARVQTRDDGALDWGDGSGRDEKWLHLVYILKVGPIRPADGLAVEQERGLKGALFPPGATPVCIYSTGSGPESRLC